MLWSIFDSRRARVVGGLDSYQYPGMGWIKYRTILVAETLNGPIPNTGALTGGVTPQVGEVTVVSMWLPYCAQGSSSYPPHCISTSTVALAPPKTCSPFRHRHTCTTPTFVSLAQTWLPTTHSCKGGRHNLPSQDANDVSRDRTE